MIKTQSFLVVSLSLKTRKTLEASVLTSGQHRIRECITVPADFCDAVIQTTPACNVFPRSAKIEIGLQHSSVLRFTRWNVLERGN